MSDPVEDIVRRFNWPHGEALVQACGAHDGFDLFGEPAGWIALHAGLVGDPSRRLRTLKLLAGHAFWQATLEGRDAKAIGAAWSRFADFTIDLALRHAWASPRNRKMVRPWPETDGDLPTIPGLFVLGLGKLGGCDLNYSSDVDLVAFFDVETLPVSAADGRGYVTARVLRDMGKILGTGGPSPVWRVDWRLRPDPSVSDISMSAEAGLHFHHFQAEPWRRLAMMKARVVAGDRVAGRAFLKELTPFLWRKHLDFRMIDEIAGLKTRIRNENPDIVAHSDDSDRLDHAGSMHLKLDRGGIREVEFIANALQLIWGGRQPDLRTTVTVEALSRLGRHGRLGAETARNLIADYHVLRRAENAVQALHDRQEYRLPGGRDAQASVAALSGTTDFATLCARILDIRPRVHGAFSALFENGPSDAKATLTIERASLDEEASKILAGWEAGFASYGVGEMVRSTLGDLPGQLLEAIGTESNPNAAIKAVESFLRKLPPGGQYLSLMATQRAFLRDIVEPVVTGSEAARLLADNPHVADSLIERGGDLLTGLVPKVEAVLERLSGERDYEAQLEAFRLVVNERLFLANLALQRGLLDRLSAAEVLTGIAEKSLDIGCRLVAATYFPNDFPTVADLPISILAMGKFGLAEMTPRSDLDLVYLARDGVPLDLADKFARRLNTALGTKMRGGVVYEIDMRLRPSGNAGPPVLRLETMRRHHMERANTWEHLALVPARMVLGPDEDRAAFSTLHREVLARPRDREQLARDAHKMLDRLRQHRIRPSAPGTLAIKLRPGGLMETEYLCAYRSLVSGVDLYRTQGAMSDDVSATLTLWRDLQMIARNLDLEDRPLSSAQGDRVAERVGVADGAALFAAMDRHAAEMSRLLDTEIIASSGLKGRSLDAWDEVAVRDA